MVPIEIEIPEHIQWTNDELYEFCTTNRNLKVERTTEGTILIMSPAGGYSSSSNAEIGADFVIWNRKVKKGKVFDSSSGFILPSGAMKGPDVAWVSRDRWDALTEEERIKFPPLCPDFVLELRSATDRLSKLQDKMQEWLDNGCRMAWLIDPIDQKSYIYRPGKEPQIVEGMHRILSGDDVLEGFELDLSVLEV
ncbi:MAG: Uma2 family endonuclease [Bacteroidota bacterium]